MSASRGRRRMVSSGAGLGAGGSRSAKEPTTAGVSPSVLLLVALAVFGIGVAGYLTSVHYAHTVLVCSDSGTIDCAKVLSSAFSVIPGTSLPITLPGIGFFLVSLLLALAQLRQPLNYGLRQAHAAWAGLGMLTVFYLVFVELVELRTICLWCTSVHLVILITLLTTIWRLYPREAA